MGRWAGNYGKACRAAQGRSCPTQISEAIGLAIAPAGSKLHLSGLFKMKAGACGDSLYVTY